jgi:hypothetical protein
LHEVVEPRLAFYAFAFRGCSFGHEGLRYDLGYHRADFTHRGAETVACASVARRETFAGDDEGCGVWAEVEEELREDVEGEEGA